MQKKRYFNWEVSVEEATRIPLGYTVGVVDVPPTPSLLRSSWSTTGEFQWDPLEDGNWVEFPRFGIAHPFPGIPVRFGYTPAGCTPHVILKDGNLYSMACEGGGIVFSSSYPGLEASAFHVDQGNGSIWALSHPSRTVYRFSPSLAMAGDIRADNTVLDVIPDSPRQSLWFIEANAATLRDYSGNILSSNPTPMPITAVRDSMVCRNTGDLMFLADSGGSGRFMHFGRAEGFLYSATVDSRSISRWGARSATIATGLDHKVLKYAYPFGISTLVDLSFYGIRTDVIRTNGGEDWYVLDRRHLVLSKISGQSGTPLWFVDLPASPGLQGYGFDVNHDSGFPRPIPFWSSSMAGACLDFGNNGLLTGHVAVSGTGSTFGSVMSGQAARQASFKTAVAPDKDGFPVINRSSSSSSRNSSSSSSSSGILTLHVTGIPPSWSPDVTGNYHSRGTWDNETYYERLDGAYFIYWSTNFGAWLLSDVLGDEINLLFVSNDFTSLTGIYDSTNTATGSVFVDYISDHSSSSSSTLAMTSSSSSSTVARTSSSSSSSSTLLMTSSSSSSSSTSSSSTLAMTSSSSSSTSSSSSSSSKNSSSSSSSSSSSKNSSSSSSSSGHHQRSAIVWFGIVNPNYTGTYSWFGTWNTKPFWAKIGGSPVIWFDGSEYVISPAINNTFSPYFKGTSGANPNTLYNPQNGATGGISVSKL